MVKVGVKDGAELDAEISVAPPGTATVVSLAGELDVSNVDALRLLLEPVVASRPPRLVFELGDLGFMDSSGIALLLQTVGRVGSLRIAHPSSAIRRLLEITGVTDILPSES